MGSITINSNIAALNAQRRLGQSTSQLRDSFTRLSSGLRINSAKDDASGLSISENLKVDARVYQQGIRNLNDAAGLLNIAEGAVRELSAIVIRQQELASQAANGSLSFKQREALNQEANALVNEYNRIISSTDYNDLTLLDGSTNSLDIQSGYGTSSAISVELTAGLARNAATGVYQSPTQFTTAGGAYGFELGDIDGDGTTDLVVADYGGGALDTISVYKGQGNGTFGARSSYEAASGSFQQFDLELGDLNNDGSLDIAVVEQSSASINILLNNGDGTFKQSLTFDDGLATNPTSLSFGDLNSDGYLDIVTANRTANQISTFLGNGDGTFRAERNTSVFGSPESPKLFDVNKDGKLDLIYNATTPDVLGIAYGLGDGSFAASISYAGLNSGFLDGLSVGDVNNDGSYDALVARSNSNVVQLYVGNQDGTFKAAVSFNMGASAREVLLEDIDGDGFDDLLASSFTGTTLSTLLSNGDGSFQAISSTSITAGPRDLKVSDLDGDGAREALVLSLSSGTLDILAPETERLSTMGALRLFTREDALESMNILEETLSRVSSELALIGAGQSRLGTAISNLQVGVENLQSASSQITDVDFSEESARLIRSRILQQAGQAILAQANQSPALALLLISG